MMAERSVEVLRQEARDELSAVIESLCRQGRDPWEFIPELPTVDEHVVNTLRDEAVEDEGLREERSRAHHPTRHRELADAFEYRLLRDIALAYPELTGAVWGMIGQPPRRAA
jgi:hypothetical protein